MPVARPVLLPAGGDEGRKLRLLLLLDLDDPLPRLGHLPRCHERLAYPPVGIELGDGGDGFSLQCSDQALQRGGPRDRDGDRLDGGLDPPPGQVVGDDSAGSIDAGLLPREVQLLVLLQKFQQARGVGMVPASPHASGNAQV